MFRKLLFSFTCLGIFLVFAKTVQAGGCGVAIEEVSSGIAGLHGAYIGVTVCEPSATDPMVNINPSGHNIEIHIVDPQNDENCKMNETVTNDYGKASGQCYSSTTENFEIYAVDTTSSKESIRLSIAMKLATPTPQLNPTPPTTPSPSAPATPAPTATLQPTATATPTPSPKATLKPTATPVIVKAEVIKQEETTSSSDLESSPAAEILADSDNKIINTNLALGFISLVLGLVTGIGLPLSWYLWQTNNKFKNSLISFWQKMPKLKLLKKYWPKKKLG